MIYAIRYYLVALLFVDADADVDANVDVDADRIVLDASCYEMLDAVDEMGVNSQ